jgi:CcmD family protein
MFPQKHAKPPREQSAHDQGAAIMKNFESLFIAYMIVWAIFFGYQVTIARRLSRLREDLERLKSQLGAK